MGIDTRAKPSQSEAMNEALSFCLHRLDDGFSQLSHVLIPVPEDVERPDNILNYSELQFVIRSNTRPSLQLNGGTLRIESIAFHKRSRYFSAISIK
jgi:hypothetical protein